MKRKKRSASHSAFSLLLPGPQILQLIIEPQVAPVAAGGDIAVLHRLQHTAPFFLCVGTAGKAALVHIGRKFGERLRQVRLQFRSISSVSKEEKPGVSIT